MSIQDLTSLLSSSLYSANSANTVKSTTTSSNGSDDNNQNTVSQADFQDSYENILSSLLARTDAIPSGTYNNSMSEVNLYGNTLVYNVSTDNTQSTTASDAAASTATAGTATTTEGTATDSTKDADAVDSTSQTGSSGSSEDSSDDTTVEIVRGADGSIYLKTTTTSSDGEATVTMTKIADGAPMGKPPIPPEEQEESGADAVTETVTGDSTANATEKAAEASVAQASTDDATKEASSVDATTTNATDTTDETADSQATSTIDFPPFKPDGYMRPEFMNQMTSSGMEVNSAGMDAMRVMGMNGNSVYQSMYNQAVGAAEATEDKYNTTQEAQTAQTA